MFYAGGRNQAISLTSPVQASTERPNALLTSSRWLEPGAYTRLQEITLGFRIPTSLARSAGMQNSRLYVSGRNLHTWTKFKGYNPDVNSNGSGSNTSLGTEFYSYPLARVWQIGVSGDF